MALTGTGKVISMGRGQMHIYVPAKVRSDSSCPFEFGDKVKVTIDGDRMIIEKERI